MTDKVKTIIFVCGPIVDRQQLRDMLDIAPTARKVAVGVTIIDSQESMNCRFSSILPRDGRPGSAFDLAPARYWSAECRFPAMDGPVAFCLLGKLSQMPLHEYAERLLRGAAAWSDATTMSIDTVIGPVGNPEARILRGFETASVILTTRLHGALHALIHGCPAIAIDQVPGGDENLRGAGEDRTDEAAIEAALGFARSEEIRSIVARCRAELIARSADALRRAADLVAGAAG